MPVGSHKDAFKAHQLVKKLMKKEPKSVLAKMAAEILIDFVKNQRQIASDGVVEALPPEEAQFEPADLDKALKAVDSLCGKCDESHDDACFVNQARRVLIAARTGIDLGPGFDGQSSLDDLLERAKETAAAQGPATPAAAPAEESATASASAPSCSADEMDALQAELDSYREKDVFRGTLIDEVVETIQSVTEGDYAAEMPVHDDEQLGKLATTFNLMLATVNKTMQDLDKIVAERNAELKQIMNTVPVGLLSLNAEGKINPEYSRSSEKILYADALRGRDFLDLIGVTRRLAEERSAAEDFFDIVRMGTLDESDLTPLCPFPELCIAREGGIEQWVRLKFYPLARGTGSHDILVELMDVTEAKRLAAEVAQSQKENTRLKAIAEDPDLFRDFLQESRTILESVGNKLSTLNGAEDANEAIHEMFRGVHTIKGAAGSFGLEDLTKAAGLLEDHLGKARSDSQIASDAQQVLQTEFDALQEALAEAASLAETILGEDLSNEGPSVRVPLHELQELEGVIKGSDFSDAFRDTVQARIVALRCVPAKKALARAVKIIPGLIGRLEKDVAFTFDGEQVSVDLLIGHALNGPLVHMIRNAFDHGIESLDLREAAGKPARGTVALTVEDTPEALRVTIRDDGKGLDPEALVNAAIGKNILTAEEAAGLSTQEKLQLIFRPGFSTAAVVTDVSGRGVGMDAVLAAIRDDLGGTVEIDSTLGTGSAFILAIPKG